MREKEEVKQMQIEEAIEIMNNFIKDTPKMPYECLMNKEVEAVETLIYYIKMMHSELDRLEGIEDNTVMLKQELIETKEHNRQLALELKKKEEENNSFKNKINEGLEDIEKALNHPYWQMARAELLYGKRLLLNLKE